MVGLLRLPACIIVRRFVVVVSYDRVIINIHSVPKCLRTFRYWYRNVSDTSAPVPKCLRTLRHWYRNGLIPKCLDTEVSGNPREVHWYPKREFRWHKRRSFPIPLTGHLLFHVLFYVLFHVLFHFLLKIMKNACTVLNLTK